MLEVGAALYQPRYDVIFEREALLSHFIDDELLEAAVFEILTRHQIKELVDHCGFTV